MFTDMFVKLWHNHIFLWGIWQTVYMTVISTAFAYVLGLPLGLILSVTDKDGIRPRPALNNALGVIVNAFRSIPFIILMVALLPVAKFVVGTSIGNKAVIVTLVVGAAPYVARMVESSIKEVDKGVIEAAEAMGTPTFQIITKVLIAEAKPSLITGAVISMVTILGYSAMAATLGGTGLGQVAVVYGHQRFNQDVIWFSALLCVLIVQVIQVVGMRIVHRTDKRINH
ncbi:MAG: ABC transporter permease [Oscillospiraceae bacterium]|nr:ABC transporter permease [Oscillospiraceae bacterium]